MSSLADGESAHPSSSIMVQVSHWEAQKPQQSGCYWICFKSFLVKLMFPTFPTTSMWEP